MSPEHLAVVMPAYNEQAGLPSFLAEIAEQLDGAAARMSFVVVNDVSTDGTAAAVEAFADSSALEIEVVTPPRNRGHGPTALEAYRRGLATGADVVLHVDGDGQFVGKDFPAVLAALDGVDVVHGVRRQRSDPWFRRVLTACVGAGVFLLSRSRVPDVNTPLRAYRRAAIARLLQEVPAEALVPHVHFSLLERRLGLKVRHVPVLSIPRRGAEATGTMWGASRRVPLLPPKRLRSFVREAAVEVWTYRVRRPVPSEVDAASTTG